MNTPSRCDRVHCNDNSVLLPRGTYAQSDQLDCTCSTFREHLRVAYHGLLLLLLPFRRRRCSRGQSGLDGCTYNTWELTFFFRAYLLSRVSYQLKSLCHSPNVKTNKCSALLSVKIAFTTPRTEHKSKWLPTSTFVQKRLRLVRKNAPKTRKPGLPALIYLSAAKNFECISTATCKYG